MANETMTRSYGRAAISVGLRWPNNFVAGAARRLRRFCAVSLEAKLASPPEGPGSSSARHSAAFMSGCRQRSWMN
jgi:hypothetical protein